MREVTLIIDGLKIKASSEDTILKAAQKSGIYIPHLCYHPDLKPFGGCRVCLVEIEKRGIVISCKAPVEEGMIVRTDTPEVNKSRKIALELLIANHYSDCLSCAKNNECKLQEISAYVGIEKERLNRLKQTSRTFALDSSNPFFIRDLNKCVLCGICVRTCEEILHVSAIDFAFRGYDTKVSTLSDKPIKQSDCVSCGECVVRCPVGALTIKNRVKPSYEVKSICPYCGVGCGIYLGIRGNTIVQVTGDVNNDVNNGKLCAKGRFGYEFVNHPDRLKKPMIKKDGGFEEVSWDTALNFVANKLKEIKEKYGSDAICGIASARVTNEENYLFQKFFRAVIGTNNVDCCARLCHAPSVVALVSSLGSGAMTNTLDQVRDVSDVIFVIGDNPSETHPITSLKVKHAVFNRHAKLIVADPRYIDLAEISDVYLQQKPGTDVALLQGIAKVIVDEGLQNEEFIKTRCENYEQFKKVIEKVNLDEVEKITGVSKEKIKDAARIYANGKASIILWGMGITQHTTGVDNALMLSNLALLTGQIGREGAGLCPLRGQNNVQGVCDMGGLPNLYPCYLSVADENNKKKMEEIWKVNNLSQKLGLTIPEMFSSIEEGKVKAMFIMGEDPVMSVADANRIREALSKLDFLVVQDIFLTETAQYADVVLPACTFAEKDGTWTNTERKVQRIRKAISPLWETKADWEIIKDLSGRMGYEMNYSSPEEIMKEISSISPLYCGINYERVDVDGICWPCPTDEHPGTRTLHTEKFTRGLGKFFPVDFKPPKEMPDNEYPLILTTGRILHQYHTGSMTRRVKGLEELAPECLVEINPQDAEEYNILDGDKIKVTSRRGNITAKARRTDKVPKGVIFIPFHYAEASANVLTNPEVDPVAKIPELKVCAVRIEKE